MIHMVELVGHGRAGRGAAFFSIQFLHGHSWQGWGYCVCEEADFFFQKKGFTRCSRDSHADLQISGEQKKIRQGCVCVCMCGWVVGRLLGCVRGRVRSRGEGEREYVCA